MTRTYDSTVILCTYNRAHWLGDAIKSLLDLRMEDGRTYEILVVDNASTDNTQEIVAEIASQTDVPLRCVRETRQGLSAARNRGIAEAQGEWLAFFDDDERAVRDWLFELRATVDEKGIRASGGSVHLITADEDAEMLSPGLQKILAPGGREEHESRFHPKHSLNGGNQMLHWTVFEEIGVYEETWTEGGEDTQFFMRLYNAGIEAWYNPHAVVLHLVPPYRMTPDYIEWLSLRQGWTSARKDKDQRGSLRTSILAALRCVRIGMMMPWYLMAWLKRDGDDLLYRRSRVWRTQGYVRGALRSVAPRVFAQEQFLSRLDFRGERQQFA